MATICHAVPASGLLSHSARRPCRGPSQLISQGVSSRMLRTSSQRDCVTCCSSNDSHLQDMKEPLMSHHETHELPIGGVATWLEQVNTAAVGVILGVGIGACCLALPAYANFLSFDHADLRGRNMSGEDLKGVVFAACDCRQINLEGSIMDGSTDTFAGFQGGNLKNSSWVRAFADRVVFRGANLQNANFTDAVLSGSQFDGADITGADFTDALVDNYQRLQMCRRAKGTNPTTGVATRESLFC